MATPTLSESGFQLITDQLMRAYTDLIYDVTGIRIPLAKKTLMSNRIRRRLRATGIAGFDEYLKHLRSLSKADAEWDAFLQEVTTHETYLFRDQSQWDWLQNQFLPGIERDASAGSRVRQLRILSAASSTGDEAYTAACCVAHRLTNLSNWKVEIVGTDIGISAIETARRATFGTRAMRFVPANLKKRFFSEVDDNWQAKETLQRLVRFRQHNLLDPISEKPFDLIFLKNVLIYFDKESKKPVIDNIRKALKPGGFLVTGPAEGVSDFLKDMSRHEAWLFQEEQG